MKFNYPPEKLRWISQLLFSGVLIFVLGANHRLIMALMIKNIGAVALLKTQTSPEVQRVEELLNYSLDLYPTASAYALLGNFYARQNKVEQAASAWQLAGWRTMDMLTRVSNGLLVEEVPRWLPYLQTIAQESAEIVRLAEIYAYFSDYERAIQAYQTALAMQDIHKTVSKSEIYYQIGFIYQFRLKPFDREKALEAYQNAANVADFTDQGSHADTYVQLATLLRGHDNEKAVTSAQKAIQIMPEHLLAHTVLGLVLYNAYGDLAAAEQQMDIAANIDPTSIWPWVHRGQLYFQAREYERAIEAYNKALEISPNLKEAQDMVKFIRLTYLEP